MNILYLCGHDLDQKTGVNLKIVDQITIWRRQNGHSITWFGVNLGQCRFEDGRRLDVPRTAWAKGLFGPVAWVIRRCIVVKHLHRIVRHSMPDLVYSRYIPYFPFFYGALKGLPLVMEINSNDASEILLTHGRLSHLWNRITRRVVYRRAEGLIFVSGELRQKCPLPSKKSILIPNSITVDKVIQAQHPQPGRGQLVFIGSPGQPWQGFDKVRQLAVRCPEIDFHVIGEHGKNTPNLRHYGYLPIQDAETIMATCHAGIGTLALHRKGMQEGLPLKNRRYLAMGLPIIYAHDDPDMPDASPFLLKLPNREDNIKIHYLKVSRFVRQIRDIPDLRAKVRALAYITVDSTRKEQARLEFMNEIAARRP